MNFSLSDYQAGFASGLYSPPAAYRPFLRVNRRQYRDLERRHAENGNDLRRAFRALRERVGQGHFADTYPIQSSTLYYSQMAFPAYRFILPEVLADDWLATVDWHRSHRDHILHQPLAAYIVLKLLRGGPDGEQSFQMPSGRSLLDECVDEVLRQDGTAYLRDFLLGTGISNSEIWLRDDPMSRELWKALFIEAAYLAAVFHDMGYPWQYVNALSNKLEYAGYPLDSPTADAARVVEVFGDRLLFCPLNGYRFVNRSAPATWRQRLHDLAARALRKTHGLPGAIGFLYLNDVLREYPTEPLHPIRQFCVEWAAMAIMMHDMPSLYWGQNMDTPPDNDHMRVRLAVDPLSSVVALADVLQDFGRPFAAFSDKLGSTTIVEVGYQSACETVELELYPNPRPNGLRIVYHMRNPVAVALKRSQLANEQRRYFDPQYGYLDFASAGVTRVEMGVR